MDGRITLHSPKKKINNFIIVRKTSLSLNENRHELTKEKIPKNNGEGFPGLDLNSGWNWAPMKKGWPGNSTICIYITQIQIREIFNNMWQIQDPCRKGFKQRHTSMRFPVSSLPTKDRPALSSCDIISGLTCTQHDNYCTMLHLSHKGSLCIQTQFTSYLCRCRSSTKLALPYLLKIPNYNTIDVIYQCLMENWRSIWSHFN